MYSQDSAKWFNFVGELSTSECSSEEQVPDTTTEDEFAEERKYSANTMESLYSLLGQTIQENLHKLKAKDKPNETMDVEIKNEESTKYESKCVSCYSALDSDIFKGNTEYGNSGFNIENWRIGADEMSENLACLRVGIAKEQISDIEDLKLDHEEVIDLLSLTKRARTKSLTCIASDTSSKSNCTNSTPKKLVKCSSSSKIPTQPLCEDKKRKYSEAVAGMGDFSVWQETVESSDTISNTIGGGDTQQALKVEEPIKSLPTCAKTSRDFPPLMQQTVNDTEKTLEGAEQEDANAWTLVKAATKRRGKKTETVESNKSEMVEATEAATANMPEPRSTIHLGDFLENGLKKQKRVIKQAHRHKRKAKKVCNDAVKSHTKSIATTAKMAKSPKLTSLRSNSKSMLERVTPPCKTAAIAAKRLKSSSSAGVLSSIDALSPNPIAATRQIPLASALTLEPTTAVLDGQFTATLPVLALPYAMPIPLIWPHMPTTSNPTAQHANQAEASNSTSTQLDSNLGATATYYNLDAMVNPGSTLASNNLYPVENKLFVGGLALTTTPEQIRDYFSMWGTVLETILVCHPNTHKSRGFAFLTYTHSDSVDCVLQLSEHILDGKRIDPKRVSQKERLLNKHTRKAFVGGISQLTTTEHIKEYFEKFGSVEKVTLMLDAESQRHRGCCFVVFAQTDTCELVCNVRYHWIQNKMVECKKALHRAAQIKASATGPGLLGIHPLETSNSALYSSALPVSAHHSAAQMQQLLEYVQQYNFLQSALAAQLAQNPLASLLGYASAQEMSAPHFYEGCNLVNLQSANSHEKDEASKDNE